MTAEREATGLVIVVNLPQPISKITELIGLLAHLWPDTDVNVRPDAAAAKLGNWLIEIEVEDG